MKSQEVIKEIIEVFLLSLAVGFVFGIFTALMYAVIAKMLNLEEVYQLLVGIKIDWWRALGLGMIYWIPSVLVITVLKYWVKK